MRRTLQGLRLSSAILLFLLGANKINAQTLEWRLVNPVYSAVDPDGVGPARGSATFKLQIHAISGTANNINTISTGWSYQLTKAMVPTGTAGPGCPATVSNPANVTVSPAFAAAGFTYTTVNQCNVFTQTTGGQTFDSRAVGTLDGSGINIGTAWIDVFTVTLWALNASAPEAGYVIINSGSGGTPGAFTTYAAADADANEYPVNSLTYTTPLGLGSGVFPITLSKFNAACAGNGALLNCETLNENNNDHFEVEKSIDGTTWNSIGTIKAAGNSNSLKQYQFRDDKNTASAYYRLRQVDIDGKFTFSSVEKTNCDNNAARLVVYPVPAKDVMNIVLTAERNSKATIKLSDITGRVIKMQRVDVLKGSNKITLNVSQVISGNYILRIEKDNEIQTKEVIIK